jgi:uncharacterized membrane protein HdeD (DUF308 family)
MSNVATKVESGVRRMTMFGVICIILGLIAMAIPALTSLSAALAVGLLVTAAGFLRMLWAFGAGSFGRGLLGLAIGFLTLLCGLAMVANPLFSLGVLTLVIAIYLIADGVAEIIGSFRMGGSGRGWLLFGGIASIVLGLMIWRQFPLSGAWAIGVLLGVKLLFVGIAMVTGGSALKSLAKASG